MKQMIKFSRSLWNAATASMETVAFELEIDTDKLPVPPLHKARSNKAGKSKALSGAVIIRPVLGK